MRGDRLTGTAPFAEVLLPLKIKAHEMLKTLPGNAPLWQCRQKLTHLSRGRRNIPGRPDVYGRKAFRIMQFV